MGEYAKYDGEEIKIGTCEDMLYLRADQAHLVTALPGNVDPIAHQDALRFRFPFPDEDGLQPGEFDDPFRGMRLYDVKAPAGVTHSTVQFTASNGYLVSLPCPESGSEGVLSLTSDGSDHVYRVHRNGYGGAVEIAQQAYRGGLLVTICKCKGCGAIYRLPTLEDAQPVIDELHKMADRETMTAARNDTPGNELAAVRLRTIADRIAAGYALPGLHMANALAEV